MPSAIANTTQDKALDDAKATVRQQIAAMRNCLDKKSRFMEALKHASTFLNELRTNSLSPKQYYELYMMVDEGLEYLSEYLKEIHAHIQMSDLYELVQYAGNIVPRLYLMITVGSVYMSIENSPVKEIMHDVMEMCRGVQHPIRGLFLRYYLSRKTKDSLPTQFGESNSAAGDVTDSIGFIVENFVEMNKLWVRWQHQGHSSEQKKRVEERKELQVLVGSNLVRISQLEAVDAQYYKHNVLPVLLEQIVKCRDLIAQEYLLDVIIQVFPDEFHLVTMDEFFSSILLLDTSVSVRAIVLTLVDRLIGFKKREPDYVAKVVADDSVDIFDKILSFIDQVTEMRPDISAEDYSQILEGVCKLSIAYYPEKYGNVDRVFQHATAIYKAKGAENDSVIAQTNWKQLVVSPITMYDDALDLLQLDSYYMDFFNLQKFSLRKAISSEIIDKFLNQHVRLTTVDDLQKVFKLLQPLIVEPEEDPTVKSLKSPTSRAAADFLTGSSALDDLEDTPAAMPKDSATVVSEQVNLAKFLHSIYNKNPYRNFELLQVAKENLQPAGHRIKYTYPALVTMTLSIVRKINLLRKLSTKKQKKKAAQLFAFVSTLISELGGISDWNTCFNLNLMTAKMADEVQLVNAAYDFFTESLLIYEEFFVESRSQYQALMSLINNLVAAKNMIATNSEGFDRLTTKTTMYSFKLLRKTDQCRAVYMSAHLWWIVEELDEDDGEDSDLAAGMSQLTLKGDGKRALECLQRSLRIADTILDPVVGLELFIEILNQSLYFVIHGNSMISMRYLNGLIELIRNKFSELKRMDGAVDSTRKHFDRTLDYIREQKTTDARFDEVNV